MRESEFLDGYRGDAMSPVYWGRRGTTPTNEILTSIKKRFPSTLASDESTEGIFDFLYGLVRLRRPNQVVEFGTHDGLATAFIAHALAENANGGTVVGYELIQEHVTNAESLISALGYESIASFVLGDVYAIEDGTIPANFAFIDIMPKNQYSDAYRKLIDDSRLSTICMHDSNFRGLSTGLSEGALACRDMLEAEGWKTINIPEERGLVVALRGKENRRT